MPLWSPPNLVLEWCICFWWGCWQKSHSQRKEQHVQRHDGMKEWDRSCFATAQWPTLWFWAQTKYWLLSPVASDLFCVLLAEAGPAFWPSTDTIFFCWKRWKGIQSLARDAHTSASGIRVLCCLTSALVNCSPFDQNENSLKRFSPTSLACEIPASFLRIMVLGVLPVNSEKLWEAHYSVLQQTSVTAVCACGCVLWSALLWLNLLGLPAVPPCHRTCWKPLVIKVVLLFKPQLHSMMGLIGPLPDS